MFDILNKKKTIKEFLMYNKPYPYLKNNYNSVIPLDIYQTWFTKDLPPKMRERVELLKAQNPRFNHHLFDDNDCREFIKTHFKPDVLEAYDTLIPGAYKADLWRLCVLFINGGIYVDIKFCCVNGFKLIELTETEHFAKDRPPNSIYNSLMACKKGNIFLYNSIRQIVENVKNRFYGNHPLSITGPILLGAVIMGNKLKVNYDMKHYEHGGYIIYKNRFVISTEYPEYTSERSSEYSKINKSRYDKMWLDQNVYTSNS
jgi:mannosyltransferase OCH1-like enzyme